MFQLKKLHPPFGTRDAPVYEGSYSEGIIPVIDGFCAVKNQDSRDYLLKIGYIDNVGGHNAVNGPMTNCGYGEAAGPRAKAYRPTSSSIIASWPGWLQNARPTSRNCNRSMA